MKKRRLLGDGFQYGLFPFSFQMPLEEYRDGMKEEFAEIEEKTEALKKDLWKRRAGASRIFFRHPV